MHGDLDTDLRTYFTAEFLGPTITGKFPSAFFLSDVSLPFQKNSIRSPTSKNKPLNHNALYYYLSNPANMLSQIAYLFETHIPMFRKVKGQRKQVTYFLNGLVIFQCSVAIITNFAANSYAYSVFSEIFLESPS